MNRDNNNISDTLFLRVRLSIWISVALVIAILCIYWQTRTFSYIYYDDPDYVFANERVQQGLTIENIKWAFTTISLSNWHPLTWISHMADFQLYGNDPSQHHLTNVLLHIINTQLLFILFRKMTGDILPSALVAGLFALHPLHIQSIAWISERKDLLCAQFFFLSIFSYLKYLEKTVLSRYLLTVLLFSLGLMAKPMIVTLPFILLLLDYWPLQRLIFYKIHHTSFRPVKPAFPYHDTKILLEKIPLFALSILSSIVTFHAQKAGGSIASLQNMSLLARGENAIVSYLLYIYKMFWPFQLSIIYPLPKSHPYWLILSAFFILSTLTVCVMFFAKKHPFFLMGWMWFLGMMVPVIGIIQIGLQSMADRYTYLPLIGLFLAFSWGLYNFSLFKNKRSLYFSITGICILLLLSVLTWKELQFWDNGIHLFQRAISVTKNNYVAHNNLGYELVKTFKFEEAKKEFEIALQIDPTFYLPHAHLGQILIDEGNVSEGIEQYRTAIKLNPNYPDAYFNLGNILLGIGNNHEAAAYYIQTLRLAPSLKEAYNNLGTILLADKKFDKSIILFQKAISLNPNFLEAKHNLEEAIWEKKKHLQEIEKNHQPNNNQTL